MALKNRVHVFTWQYDGDEIQLQANFRALEALSEATGMDALDYIQSMQKPRELVETFFHLQFGTEHTRDEIHEAFFSESTAFAEAEMQEQLARMVLHLIGGQKAVQLWEEEKKSKDTKKK